MVEAGRTEKALPDMVQRLQATAVRMNHTAGSREGCLIMRKPVRKPWTQRKKPAGIRILGSS